VSESPFAPLEPGDPAQIGRFGVLFRLGAGGFGRVFLGRTPAGRLVAVKVPHPDLAADPEFRRRFADEVAAVGLVVSMYTAPVVAADATADPPWLATEAVTGTVSYLAGHKGAPTPSASGSVGGSSSSAPPVAASGSVAPSVAASSPEAPASSQSASGDSVSPVPSASSYVLWTYTGAVLSEDTFGTSTNPPTMSKGSQFYYDDFTAPESEATDGSRIAKWTQSNDAPTYGQCKAAAVLEPGYGTLPAVPGDYICVLNTNYPAVLHVVSADDHKMIVDIIRWSS